MKNFKEFNDVLSKNDGFKSRLIRNCLLNSLNQTNRKKLHDNKNQHDKKWVIRMN